MNESLDVRFLIRSINHQVDQSLSDQNMAISCVTENMGNEDAAVECILKGLEESSDRFSAI